jgi:hypothetical protein
MRLFVANVTSPGVVFAAWFTAAKCSPSLPREKVGGLEREKFLVITIEDVNYSPEECPIIESFDQSVGELIESLVTIEHEFNRLRISMESLNDHGGTY